MFKEKKKFYITTSIAYANAPPHIGFALELVQADVLARYQRMLRKDVYFLTGTDEHGAKIAEAAEKEIKNPQEFVNEISKRFMALDEVLKISNDDFIRTSDQIRHWPSVYVVWLKLKEKKILYKKKYQGLYCVGCESFITKKDLIDGKCIYHQREPEVIEEENYFFRLSKFSNKIKELIEDEIIKIIPGTRKNEVLSFIKGGLEDVSFSRPREALRWGIPAPDDPSQTIYVWCDALINYISAIGYNESPTFFRKYWPADVHCVGKDILKFHAIIWPAMLLALGLDVPNTIFVHGFITVGGQKMSKSLGNIINPFELIEKYGADSVRYYLLREIISTEDGDFTYEKFEKRYNSDLAGGIGNLLARIMAMTAKPDKKTKKRSHLFSGIISGFKLKRMIKKTWRRHKKSLEKFKFQETLKAIWELIGFCDKIIEKEKLWENRNRRIIKNLLIVLENIAKMLEIFLPDTAEKILKTIEKDEKSGEFKNKKNGVLFPRITNY